MKSQIGKTRWGRKRKPPRVFKEHGVLMAANIMDSKKAIATSVLIVKAFVQMRKLVTTHAMYFTG